jgi:hypothetical protein
MFCLIYLLTSILYLSAATDVDSHNTENYCRTSSDKLFVSVAKHYVSSHFCDELDMKQATEGVYIGPEKIKLTLTFIPFSNPTTCTCIDDWDWVFSACKFA